MVYLNVIAHFALVLGQAIKRLNVSISHINLK